MTIRPSERPQSIREWLALFGKKDVEEVVAGDDEATRFFAHEMASNEISAVAPTAPGIDQKDLDTGVPKDPADVQFKRAGEETGASKKGRRRRPTRLRRPPRPAEPVEPKRWRQRPAEEARTGRRAKEAGRAAAQGKGAGGQVVQGSTEGDACRRRRRRAVAAIAAGTFMMTGGSGEVRRAAGNSRPERCGIDPGRRARSADCGRTHAGGRRAYRRRAGDCGQ